MKISIIKILQKKLKNILISTISFWVVLISWMILADNFNPLILPSPAKVIDVLMILFENGELQHHFFISIRRTIIGYSSAVVFGIVLALLLAKSWILRKIFRPLITVIQSTPPIIWLVLAVIWFGISDDLTPIFLIFIVSLPIIFINVYEGIKSIDQKLVEMAYVFNSSRKKILKDIYLPSLIPYLLSALSIAFAFAWKSTVFAEYLGSASGIGYALSMANSNLETAELFAWAIVLVVFMLIVEYLILAPLQRKVMRWKENGNSN